MTILASWAKSYQQSVANPFNYKLGRWIENMELMENVVSKIPTAVQAPLTGIATGLITSDLKMGVAGAAINAVPHLLHIGMAGLEATVHPTGDTFNYDMNNTKLARRQGFRCGLAAIGLTALFALTRDNVAPSNKDQPNEPKLEMAFPRG